MHIPKRYFHDRMVLLLLATNAFLALVGIVSILLRLDAERSNSYIVEYRETQLGRNAFTSGSSREIWSFVLFILIVAILHTLLSIRVYGIRRHFAIAVLGMGVLLLVLAILVSNALLVL